MSTKPAEKPPSEVFAERLREVRAARGMSRPALARRMTEVGRPMNKLALLRIEKGDRKLSLDEALAIAWILSAAPAHMISPPADEHVWITDEHGVDGGGLRHFLQTGFAVPAWPASPREEDRAELQLFLMRALTAHAAALVDAGRGGDKAGAQAAVSAIEAALERHRKALAEIEDTS